MYAVLRLNRHGTATSEIVKRTHAFRLALHAMSRGETVESETGRSLGNEVLCLSPVQARASGGISLS